MKYLFLSFSLFFLGFTVQAQWEKEVVNSAEVIYAGINYHDQEEYDKAIAEYDKILEGDTNYVWALYEKTYSLYNSKKYEECAAVCKEGIAYDEDDVPLFYSNLGNAYDEMDEFELSIQAYEEALEKYPANYLLYYNMAGTYLNNEKYDKAIENYKKALYYNPYHENSHLQIGALALDEGMLAEGTMAWMTYLLINPASNRSQDILDMLDYTLSKKPDYEKKGISFSDKGDSFKEINTILESQIALNSKYKFNSDVDYSVVRQAHALMEKLQDYEPSGGFFDEIYVPFYKDLFAEGYFEGMSYYLVASSPSSKVQATIVKNDKAISNFNNWYFDKLQEYFAKRDDTYFHFYSSPNDLYGIGNTNDDGNEEGSWELYDREGYLAADGEFSDGMKVGKWTYYFNDGSIESFFNRNDDGELEGAYEMYWDNGNKRREGSYDAGSLNGEVLDYYPSGGLFSKSIYDDGVLSETFTEYYENGQVYYTVEYEDGDHNGELKVYFPNGNLMREVNRVDGWNDGLETYYAFNGTLTSAQNYKEGEWEGEVKTYYKNGNVRMDGVAKNGGLIGEVYENYLNGNLYKKAVYDENGKYTGTYQEFDLDGVLFYEADYVKGEESSFKYYDKEGNLLVEQKVKGKMDLSTYYPSGELKQKGEYIKSKRSGNWFSYYRNGQVSYDYNYKDGELDGKYEKFFKNGKLNYVTYYEDGEENGYFKRYDINGTLVIEGRMNNGQNDGPWKYYDKYGTLVAEDFYVNGMLNGPDYSYDINGNLSSTAIYDMDYLEKTYLIDTNGKEYFVVDVVSPEVKIEYPSRYGTTERFVRNYKNEIADGVTEGFHLNGAPDYKGQYLNDERHGKWEWHTPNGEKVAEGNYEYGDLEGIYYNYDLLGNLKFESNYFGDETYGLQTRYFPWGDKFYETNEYNGENNGLKHIYGSNEQLIMSIYFLQSDYMYYITYEDPDNPDTTYIENETARLKASYANGQEAISFEIKNGLREGSYKIYQENGKPIYIASFKNNRLDGFRTYYYPSGEKYATQELSEGDYNGEVAYFAKNGTKTASLRFFKDEKHGTSKFYNEDGRLLRSEKYYDGTLIELN